jgi:hypothetical protein
MIGWSPSVAVTVRQRLLSSSPWARQSETGRPSDLKELQRKEAAQHPHRQGAGDERQPLFDKYAH